MIKYTIKNNTGVITLNRPEKRNALHPEMIKQILDKLNESKNSSSVKSLVITGAGSSFCSGADLEYLTFLKGFSTIDNEKDSILIADLLLSVFKFPKPTIAAVNGPAIAGGCGLASVCDFIIAHPDKSKFGYSEVKIGFIPAIVAVFLIKKIGFGMAKAMLLSGEILEGQRAYDIGFANYISEDPLKYAFDLAKRIENNSQSSIKMTKELLNTISSFDAEEAVEYCIKINTVSRTSKDFIEGLNKFLTKK